MVKGILLIVLLIGVVIFFWFGRDYPSAEFVECLRREGVVIYGSSVCPLCRELEREYGGYDNISSIYLDCGKGSKEEIERCREEMKGEYVPEVQIGGELFEGWGSPENLSQETGCEL